VSPRPLCVYCGKPIPKLTTTVWVGSASDKIKHQDSSWSRYVYPEEPLRSIAECRRLSNQQVISLHYGFGGTVSRFAEWDGQTYWCASQPCCSGTCAVKFARAAHKAGYRLLQPGEQEVVP
jgi:hypothetical protein